MKIASEKQLTCDSKKRSCSTVCGNPHRMKLVNPNCRAPLICSTISGPTIFSCTYSPASSAAFVVLPTAVSSSDNFLRRPGTLMWQYPYSASIFSQTAVSESGEGEEVHDLRQEELLG